MKLNFSIDNLKESNEFLNILLENITSAIFIVDDDLKVHNFNDSFRTLFYKLEDKILDLAVGNIMGCQFAEEFNADCGDTEFCSSCILRNSLTQTLKEKVNANKQLISRYFYLNNKKVHKYFSFSTRAINYNGENMILVIIDDVTELEEQKIKLKEQNAKLEKLNDLKNEFLGMAAHDLRSPIGVVQTFSEMLLRADENTSIKNYKSILKNMHEVIESSLSLLNELLDISKIDSGKLELTTKMTDYTNLINKEIEFCRILAMDKNISIVFELNKEIPLLLLDRIRMKQVINNLLINAIKYSFPDSSIVIKLELMNNNIVTRIIDHGQGIAEKEIPYIFDTYHTSSSSSDNQKSTGLGLAIVKKIVEKHKGQVGVKSKVGSGSEFHFSLPIVMV